MITYNAAHHTPEALAEQLAVLHDHAPDYLLLGSLGRAAAYHLLIGDADYELRCFNDDYLHTSFKARDIDIIAPGLETPADGPFIVDTACFDNRSTAIVRDGDDWWLTAADREFAEPLHPAVMEPLPSHTFFGIACNTPPWQTQYHLPRLRGATRRKDVARLALLAAVGCEHPDNLPVTLFEPFERLAATAPKGWESKARAMYHANVPKPIDLLLDRALSFVRRKL